MAVRTRDTKTVRRLCASKPEHLKAAVQRRDGQGHTLMHWAAKAGDVETLQLLSGEYPAQSTVAPELGTYLGRLVLHFYLLLVACIAC